MIYFLFQRIKTDPKALRRKVDIDICKMRDNETTSDEDYSGEEIISYPELEIKKLHDTIAELRNKLKSNSRTLHSGSTDFNSDYWAERFVCLENTVKEFKNDVTYKINTIYDLIHKDSTAVRRLFENDEGEENPYEYLFKIPIQNDKLVVSILFLNLIS